MKIFDYRAVGDTNLAGRFKGFNGDELWNALVENPTRGNLHNLQKVETGFGKGPKEFDCPRVFVSHKRADTNRAVRIAEIACNNSFAYWLDILDLTIPPGKVANIQQKNILIAGIIEMALINCTHVLAVMTTNTKGSFWVPYEYGRICALPTDAGRAAAWVYPKNLDPPEYLEFGVLAYTKDDIRTWLQAEKSAWANDHDCICSWSGGETEELPDA